MEIKMIECPNGHYYNAATHASCPECAKVGGSAEPTFPKTTAPGAAVSAQAAPIGSTMPVNGGGATIGHTMPVGGGGNVGGATLGHTMPVNNAGGCVGGTATPFGVPTMPGGGLAADSQLEPVVGWLVCIDGPLRGVDFRIHDGYNYIGREEGDIHIHGDSQISRAKHAVISFYAKRQSFHVGPADGRNIIELNGEPVFSPMEMKSFDVLTVGSTKLMLVALCGEKFSWTEGVAND